MASDTSDPDAIQHLDSEIIEDSTSVKLDESTAEKAPVRHRMHRSAVRPFLCCGSEISLVSLVDTFDVHGSGDTAQVATSVTAATPLTTSTEGASCSGCRRSRKRTEKVQQNKSKKKFWSLRGKLGNRFVGSHNRSESQSQPSSACSTHRKRSGSKFGSGAQASDASGQFERMLSGLRVDPNICMPFIDISRVNFDALYPTRDMDEIRREERAREIEEGIDISHQRWSSQMLTALVRPNQRNIVAVPTHQLFSSPVTFPTFTNRSPPSSSDYEDSIYEDTSLCLQALAQRLPSVFQNAALNHHPAAHSQVEFIHCLVPGLREITKCSFYWGVMDRYEAETLLENKPEGTFLLRDSAQEDFLFSVSFRRYNRSLHARIEQWNHLFSFDAHDPAVFACDSVVGLIEHYKDPECCMFFEPMLTLPLNRTSCFPLKHLCRSEICSNITYDHINALPLPSSMKEYLKYYHYKQKVRMKRLDIAS